MDCFAALAMTRFEADTPMTQIQKSFAELF